MINVMIVDDRPLFREYLIKKFEWDKYGFNICGEAKNGVEALEKAKEIPPDVLLTDINMPLMDGLELSERLIEEYPDMGVVLITAHSEFEYAKKALEIGVCSYIVKPFEKEELILTLLKLKDNINKANEENIQKEDKERDLLELLLQQLIYREKIQKDEEFQRRFSKLGISFDSKSFIASVIEINKKEDIGGGNHIWKRTIINMLQQMLQPDLNMFVISDYEGRIVILSETDKGDDEFSKDELSKLMKLINKHLGFDMTIGIGRLYRGFDGIRKSYLEGVSAIRYSFEVGNNKIIYYSKISKKSKEYIFYSAETNELILKYLRNGDIQGINRMLIQSYEGLIMEKAENEFTEMIYKGLLSVLFSYIYQSGREIDDILGDRNHVMQKTREKNLNRQLEILIDFYEKTIDFSKKFENTRSYKLVKGSKKYIKENYFRHDLAIKDVSKSQYINETYLRSLFKKETGMTVNEYITNIRLDKTKEILKTTEYRLADIADMVGYNDSSYLSKIFKKNIGISPSKYRYNHK
jgi:two-component system response regulator YesN